jgi:hypothetical protein
MIPSKPVSGWQTLGTAVADLPKPVDNFRLAEDRAYKGSANKFGRIP